MSKKNSRLQSYVSQQFVDFDLEHPTQRLKSLYSDFSSLHILNEIGYDANVSYWRSVILDCNCHGFLGNADYRLAFDLEDLPDQFQHSRLGKPMALQCVIDAMVQQGDLISLDGFLSRYALPTASSSRWSVYNVVKTWVWPIKSSSASATYVVLPTLERVVKYILQSYANQPVTQADAHLLTFPEFRERHRELLIDNEEIVLTDADLWLVLRYLRSRAGVSVADDVKGYGANYTVVKIPHTIETATVITQQDRAIVSIKTTCHALRAQVDELQMKSDELTALAKQHYAEKRKPQALYAFRRKKHMMDILDRRLKSLETMETMLLRIEASQNDLQVVQAFNIGADALQSVLRDGKLSVATVDEAMLKVQEAFEDQKEVEDAINMGAEQASKFTDVDDDELEKELQELERQQEDVSLATSPPLRKTVQSAPPPSRTDSELARISHLFSQLRKAEPPPSKAPVWDSREQKENDQERRAPSGIPAMFSQ
ncbi:Snf7-domain-containing protein [Dichotomocladium elegans]|nr:Snf7-domain-containing protein [Dichotomocladium elegans]